MIKVYVNGIVMWIRDDLKSAAKAVAQHIDEGDEAIPPDSRITALDEATGEEYDYLDDGMGPEFFPWQH